MTMVDQLRGALVRMAMASNVATWSVKGSMVVKGVEAMVAAAASEVAGALVGTNEEAVGMAGSVMLVATTLEVTDEETTAVVGTLSAAAPRMATAMALVMAMAGALAVQVQVVTERATVLVEAVIVSMATATETGVEVVIVRRQG